MTDNERKKRNFRASVKWKKFRHFKNVEQKGLCYITHKKLLKRAQLHHMDLNPEHYEDISKPENFVFVNASVHDWLHEIYRYYKTDPTILDRLREVLDKMVEINNGK